jgi:hypothetical protein
MDKKKNKTAKRKSPIIGVEEGEETLNTKSKKEKKNTRKSADPKTKPKPTNHDNNIHEEIKDNPQEIDTKSPKSQQKSSHSKSKSDHQNNNCKSNSLTVVSGTNSSYKSGDQINICSWNVNGLRAIINKGTLNEFVEKGNQNYIQKTQIFCA